jgi:hypothetical protein
MSPSYAISADGKSITCLVCTMTSFHPVDVRERFCSRCKVFCDDRDREQQLRQGLRGRLDSILHDKTLL